MRYIILLAITLAVGTSAHAERAAVTRCKERVQYEIDQINARMRQPYGSHEGQRLRDRLKILNDQLYGCRKAR